MLEKCKKHSYKSFLYINDRIILRTIRLNGSTSNCFFSGRTNTEETLQRSDGSVQTCLWSRYLWSFFLVSCYKGLKKRNVGKSFVFFTHNPTLVFNNYNNRPSCHCGFKQPNSFFKIHVSFVSSDQQSRLCFPGRSSVNRPEGVRWSSSAPRLPQKELRQEEEEVGGRKVRRWWRDRLQEERREDYSSISLLLSEIKDDLRINWISSLNRFPLRSNTDFRNVGDEPTVNRVQSQHGWMLSASSCCRDLN